MQRPNGTLASQLTSICEDAINGGLGPLYVIHRIEAVLRYIEETYVTFPYTCPTLFAAMQKDKGRTMENVRR